MTRRDWLMLFIAFEGAPEGLDPVRLQKGLFLFAKEAEGLPPQQRYAFKPYSYGPMSSTIYADLDGLVADGLVEKDAVEGQTWSRYRPSLRGVELAHRLIEDAMAAHPNDTRHFYAIKQDVASKSFAALLEDVYAKYPEYATRSVFKRN